MIELLKALQVIETIKKIGGAWDVFHHVGEGELSKETALRLSDGKVSIISGGTIRATYKDGGKQHELRGSVAFSNFRYREIIKWDNADVDSDDIYISSHLSDGSDRRVILDFKFTQDGTRHIFRFRKGLEV